MSKIRLNLYQRGRDFQFEISDGGTGYRLFGPKFDGSSRLIRSVILSNRDKEEIIGYVKPDAQAAIRELVALYSDTIRELLDDLKAVEGERDRLRDGLQTTMMAESDLRKQIATLTAMCAAKDLTISALEEDVESHVWEISPAMAQAKIDELNDALAASREEVGRLREALQILDRTSNDLDEYMVENPAKIIDVPNEIYKPWRGALRQTQEALKEAK